MDSLIGKYIGYISGIRRYSERTCDIYHESLLEFARYVHGTETGDISPEDLVPQVIRGYEVHLLEDKKMVPRTVNLHMSVLSSFCRYLLKQGILQSNPVKSVTRPKMEKRLPEFFRKESMEEYFRQTEYYASEGKDFTVAEFEFYFDTASFIQYFGYAFSLAGLERITGINQKQLGHYVSGYRKPSPKTVKKIEEGVRNFTKDLSMVHFA